jgi:hypothetical protein
MSDDVEYARVIEERRYVIDVLDRVEMLAFTYSRLNALSGLYRDAEAQMDMTKRVTRQEPLTWGIPDEVEWQRDCRAREAQVLVAFVYYELTSLAHMLRGLKVRIPGGELEYLVKARDKFLAHPRFGSRTRNAHGAMSIPRVGLLHAHAIHANETDPVLLSHYSASFAPRNAADEAHLRDENERGIGRITADSDPGRDAVFASRTLQDAVLRNLQVLCESVGRIDRKYKRHARRNRLEGGCWYAERAGSRLFRCGFRVCLGCSHATTSRLLTS